MNDYAQPDSSINPQVAPSLGAPMEAQHRDEWPFWGYADIFMMVAIILFTIVLAVGGMGALFGVYAVVTKQQVDTKMIMSYALPMQLVIYVVAGLMVWGWFRYRYGQPLLPAIQFTRPEGALWKYFVAGMGAALLVGGLGALLKADNSNNELLKMAKDPLMAAGIGFFAVFLAPFFEEVPFRGIMQPVLARDIGAPAAMVLLGLLFASIHGPQYGWAWQYMLVLTLASCIFGYVRYRTGNTMAAAILHAGYNSMQMVGLVLLHLGVIKKEGF